MVARLWAVALTHVYRHDWSPLLTSCKPESNVCLLNSIKAPEVCLLACSNWLLLCVILFRYQTWPWSLSFWCWDRSHGNQTQRALLHPAPRSGGKLRVHVEADTWCQVQAVGLGGREGMAGKLPLGAGFWQESLLQVRKKSRSYLKREGLRNICSGAEVSRIAQFSAASLLVVANVISQSSRSSWRRVLQPAKPDVDVTAFCKKESALYLECSEPLVSSSPGKISKPGFALCLIVFFPLQLPNQKVLHLFLARALRCSRDCISVAEPSFIWCPGKETLQAAGVATWDLFLLCVMSRSISHPAEAVYVSLAIALELALFLQAGVTTS